MAELNNALLEKAKAAKSPEEIIDLAKENDISLSVEEANAYFEQLHKTGELSDEELDSVAGGGCGQEPQQHKYDMFADRAHVMRRGYKLCYESRRSSGCMSPYWIVQKQNEDTGYVEWECPRCGRQHGEFVGNLVEV